jgi:hypothetical protein
MNNLPREILFIIFDHIGYRSVRRGPHKLNRNIGGIAWDYIKCHQERVYNATANRLWLLINDSSKKRYEIEQELICSPDSSRFCDLYPMFGTHTRLMSIIEITRSDRRILNMLWTNDRQAFYQFIINKYENRQERRHMLYVEHRLRTGTDLIVL